MPPVDPQTSGELNLREQIARIDNLIVGSQNLLIDSQKKQREFHLAIWQMLIAGLGAGAAIFAAGAAAMKALLGH